MSSIILSCASFLRPCNNWVEVASHKVNTSLLKAWIMAWNRFTRLLNLDKVCLSILSNWLTFFKGDSWGSGNNKYMGSLPITALTYYHRQPKHTVSILYSAQSDIESILEDFVWGQILNSQNRCKLVQTAQIKFPYLSCCSLVSFLYILGPLEAIWMGFSFQSSKSPLMALECTRMTQESNNWGKETLFVLFAPIYNDFADSIFVPIQSLLKSTQYRSEHYTKY